MSVEIFDEIMEMTHNLNIATEEKIIKKIKVE